MDQGPASQFNDQEIIEHIRQEGADRKRGEDQLFGCYAYFIREGMSKHSLTEDDAFSAYSDSVLSAIDHIASHRFEGRSSLKTWLFQIFHNKCVDLIRKKTTNKGSVHQTESISERLNLISDSARPVIQQLIDQSDWAVLKQRLNEIGDNCKKLLGLWSESYSDREIAQLMQYKTADVVKTSRLRCLEKLRLMYRQP